LGEFDNTPAATAKLVRKLAAKYERLTFCYEAVAHQPVDVHLAPGLFR
jgi:hypothetical protein